MEPSKKPDLTYRIVGIMRDGSRMVTHKGLELATAQSFHRDLTKMRTDFERFEIEPEDS